jgi:dipeptidyl aminopeptidase/acylaminoacyl peptidase
MEHPLVLRVAALVVALTLAACGGSTPTPALTSAPPSLEATPDATAAGEPSGAATATALPAPSGRILFSAVVPTTSFGSIYVMNADGSGRTDLTGTRGGDEPAWSPDGKRIAFVREDGIWVMHADGSQAKQIRHDPAMIDQWPSWSPDGGQIAYTEVQKCAPCSIGITFTLNIMNADGSGLRKLTDAADSFSVAWSPDGKTIVFSEAGTAGLQSIRLDGSGLRQLTTGPDSYPAWSPSGRMAFLRGATTAGDGSIIFSLVVDDVGASPAHEVRLPFFIAGGPLAWSPDGGWIALPGVASGPLLAGDQWDIWIVRPDGTGAMALTKTPDGGEEFPSWH